ncbi:MAG: hypothetical protein RIS35_2787, partial [Pseudomonadota bacterium]
LDLFARLLALEGASATLAGDGRQVIELLQAQPEAFDAVLMDLQMPVLDGLGATRAIREALGLVDLPVIACSAGALAEDADRARAAGVDDFVTKPVDHERLVAVLGAWTRPAAVLAKPDPAAPSVSAVIATPDPDAAARSSPMPEFAPSSPAPDASQRFPVIEGIDRARVERLLHGDRAFFLRSLRRFRDEFETLPRRLERMLGGDDRGAAGAALHKLRGAAGNLGASALAENAARLEASVRSGDLIAPQRLAGFAAELEALLSAAAPWCEQPTAGARQQALDPQALDPQALEALRIALRERKLSVARRRFDELTPALTAALGAEAFAEVAGAMDGLRFDEVRRRLDELACPTGDPRGRSSGPSPGRAFPRSHRVEVTAAWCGPESPSERGMDRMIPDSGGDPPEPSR